MLRNCQFVEPLPFCRYCLAAWVRDRPVVRAATHFFFDGSCTAIGFSNSANGSTLKEAGLGDSDQFALAGKEVIEEMKKSPPNWVASVKGLFENLSLRKFQIFLLVFDEIFLEFDETFRNSIKKRKGPGPPALFFFCKNRLFVFTCWRTVLAED